MPDGADGAGPRIDTLRVGNLCVPTDGPESDGTFEWDKTTAVVVEAAAGGVTGLGYTYADRATAVADPRCAGAGRHGPGRLRAPRPFTRDGGAVRNVGRAGIACDGHLAVDVALWDLKARLLGRAAGGAAGRARRAVPDLRQRRIHFVRHRPAAAPAGRMGGRGHEVREDEGRRDPAADPDRVRAARAAIGDRVAVRRRDRRLQPQAGAGDGGAVRGAGVPWFEEPVSSDDLDGLRLVRDGFGGQMDVAAGEYGYDPSTSAACWPRARLTCCRRTARAAGV